MTKEKATELMNTYGRAWVTQDPDLVTTIFTEDARYYEPREPENVGKEAIRAYWQSKCVESQKDITFDLKHVWMDGDTGIAEWDASFVDTIRNIKIDLKSVAIFTISGDLISSQREYYKSFKTLL